MPTVWKDRLSAGLAILVAVPLVASGLIHLSHPMAFLDIVLRYGLVGGWFAVAMATVLPAAQLACGLWMLLQRTVASTWWLVGGLYLVFSVAQWSVVLRGQTLACGCFGDHGRPITVYSAAMVLAAAAACWIVGWNRRGALQRTPVEVSSAREPVAGVC